MCRPPAGYLTRQGLRQPERDLREGHDQREPEDHHRHEGAYRAVDVGQRHLGRGHGAHQEQVVAEGRRHVGDLAGDGVEHAIPDQVELQHPHDRHVERRDDHQHRGVVEERAHDQEAQLHQDQDLPAVEAQVLDEERADEIHRAQPVEHRPEGERGEDDPQEHARNRQRHPVQVSSTAQVMRPLSTEAATAASAPMTELSTSRV
jgi:hypothetical protein